MRRGRASDAPGLARLIDELRGDLMPHHSPLGPRLHGFLRGNSAIFVADADGSLIGMVLVQRRSRLAYARPEMWLGDLVVDPGWRGKGVGRALVEAAELQARRWGCATIRAESRSSRPQSHAFYGANGYPTHGVSFEKVL